MPVVASVDYAARRIYIAAAVDSNLDTLEVYREVRALLRTDETHRKYKPMIEASGNIVKITGVSYTPAYVRLLYGCRIVPYNVSHRIRLVRDTFTDDGRDCFDRTPLSVSVDVDIDVGFPEIEIREVTISGSTGPTAADIAAAVRSNLIVELQRIDASISSRNSTVPPTQELIASAESATEISKIKSISVNSGSVNVNVESINNMTSSSSSINTIISADKRIRVV